MINYTNFYLLFYIQKLESIYEKLTKQPAESKRKHILLLKNEFQKLAKKSHQKEFEKLARAKGQDLYEEIEAYLISRYGENYVQES